MNATAIILVTLLILNADRLAFVIGLVASMVIAVALWPITIIRKLAR